MPGGPLLENSGEIDAGNQRIRLAAGDALGLAIRNTGALRAGQIQVTGGATGTVELSGELDARNRGAEGRGGVIEATGENVALLSASLDASSTSITWTKPGPAVVPRSSRPRSAGTARTRCPGSSPFGTASSPGG